MVILLKLVREGGAIGIAAVRRPFIPGNYKINVTGVSK
jgi:hypothetical protein